MSGERRPPDFLLRVPPSNSDHEQILASRTSSGLVRRKATCLCRHLPASRHSCLEGTGLPALNPRPRMGRPLPRPGERRCLSQNGTPPAVAHPAAPPRNRGLTRRPVSRSALAAAVLLPRRNPDPGVLPRSDPSGPYLRRPLTHTACPPPPHTHAHMLITAPTPGGAAVPGPTPAGRRAPVLADPGQESCSRSARPRLGGPWTVAPSFRRGAGPAPPRFPG